MVAAALTVVALSACLAPSSEELAASVQDLPSVISVEVTEADGDDTIGSIPKVVSVTMESDSTRAEIMAVFDEYADERRDGSVQTVWLDLVGDTTASTNSGLGALDRAMTVMVAAVAEPDMDSVEMPSGQELRLEMSPVGFERVQDVAATYWGALRNPQDLLVQSDAFVVIRGPKRADRFRARTEVAEAVHREFGLTGVRLAAYFPLELIVTPGADLDAVRAVVAQTADPRLVGKFEVRDDAGVDLTGARGDFLLQSRRVVNAIRYDDAFRWAAIRDGELQVGADTVPQALELDGYYGSGEDAGFESLPLRYVIRDGSDVGKVKDVWIHHSQPLHLAGQDEWDTFSWTQHDRQSQLRVVLTDGVGARRAAQSLAKATGGTAICTIVWPSGTGLPPVTVTPDQLAETITLSPNTDPAIGAELKAGWAEGLR